MPHVRIADAFAPPCTIELPYPDLCQRYAARVLQNVTIAPSPLWMQRRLERAGIRPRNVVVDVTNYVMLECGQPLHAFDFQTIRGGRIIVRPASQGESITTLDGIERSLDPTMLCIADVERPLAIAGVMGAQILRSQRQQRRCCLSLRTLLPLRYGELQKRWDFKLMLRIASSEAPTLR